MSWQDNFPKEQIFWKPPRGILYNGDVLEVLKRFPDESIETIITSPPYWGLRDYGEETYKIWGGDPACNHEWGNEVKKFSKPRHGIGSKVLDIQSLTNDVKEKKYSGGSFCKKCEAWYGQLGLEPTLDLYLDHLLQITAELKRVLKKTGVMFWNHGDNYGGSGRGHQPEHFKNPNNLFGQKFNFGGTTPAEYLANLPKCKDVPPKCMCLQNYRLIIKMIDEQGWILRNIIIWYKPNHMPSSVKDRFTNAYEPVFMLVKNKKYWFDLDAVRVPIKGQDQRERCGQHPLGKNPGDLWTIPTQPFPEAHFATYPEKLVEPMIKAGCPDLGVVLDPFFGSGTTGLVAEKLNRNWIGIELNKEYCEIAKKRLYDIATQNKVV